MARARKPSPTLRWARTLLLAGTITAAVWTLTTLSRLADESASVRQAATPPPPVKPLNHGDEPPSTDPPDAEPWAKRRGLGGFDQNSRSLLVKAGLDAVTAALEKRAVRTIRDVLGAEVLVEDGFAFAFQLKNHRWSVVLPEARALDEAEAVKAFSGDLDTTVLDVVASDTTGFIGYEAYESGRRVEVFEGYEGPGEERPGRPPNAKKLVLHPYPENDPEAVQTAFFWSESRNVTPADVVNIWSFPDRVVAARDAFDPGITPEYLLDGSVEFGSRVRVRNAGFTTVHRGGRETVDVPDLVRVDYFRFAKELP